MWSKKKARFQEVINKPIIHMFFKNFTNNHIEKPERVVVFSHGPLPRPAFLNAKTTDETFQQSRMQDTFKHTLRISEPALECNQYQMP